MAMYNLVQPFSIDGLNKLQSTFKMLQSNIDMLHMLFVTYSLQFIRESAIQHIKSSTGHSWYVPTGELERSFVMDIIAQTLINTAPYSAFVEYGTGMWGESANGYVTNMSGKGQKGWGFEVDGIKHFTHGQEPHRFLWNAIMEYQMAGYRIAWQKALTEVLSMANLGG